MAPTTAEPESNTMDTPANGRDAQGRFVKGNKGGPGNPFGRHLAQMRQVVAEAVSEEDLRQILGVLVAKAKEGDVPAAKLVLQYAVGKPQSAADPDRVDVEEWQLTQASNVGAEALQAVVLTGMPVQLATTCAQVMTPVKVVQMQELVIRNEAKLQAGAVQEAVDVLDPEEELDPEITEAEEWEAIEPTREELMQAFHDPREQEIWDLLYEEAMASKERVAAPSANGENGEASAGRREAPSVNGVNGKPMDRKRGNRPDP